MKIPDQIQIFIEALLKNGAVEVKYSSPAVKSGIWWLEIKVGSETIDVSYQPSVGFGFFEEEAQGLEFMPHLLFNITGEAIKYAQQQLRGAFIKPKNTIIPELMRA